MNRNYPNYVSIPGDDGIIMPTAYAKECYPNYKLTKEQHERCFPELNNPVHRKLYMIGSLANRHIPRYAKLLRLVLGWEVFDDWHAAHPKADSEWRDYEIARGHSYSEALRGPAAQNVYKFDLGHLNSSTHALLVLPAGRSGHLELGWMAGAGKATAILLDADHDRWDVMYAFADIVTTDINEIMSEWADTTHIPTAREQAICLLPDD